MTRKKCLSCQGVYNPDQPGGYYHACPPGTRDPRDENIVTGKLLEPDKNGLRVTERTVKLEGMGTVDVVEEV